MYITDCISCGRETIDGDCYGCEVDRLVVELNEVKKALNNATNNEYAKWELERSNLEARAISAELALYDTREKLLKYGRHLKSCPAVAISRTENTCRCGWEQEVRKLKTPKYNSKVNI
jgi:hypothetical protein